MKKKIIFISIVIVVCIIALNAYPVIKDHVRELAHEKNVEYFQQQNTDAEISYTVDSEADTKERTLFRLRTREGLDISKYPQWGQTLKEFCKQGLLTREGSIYRLTSRGTEVCDSILAELV